jgi:hypothetical protein
MTDLDIPSTARGTKKPGEARISTDFDDRSESRPLLQQMRLVWQMGTCIFCDA